MGNFPAKTCLHWKVLTAFVTPNILAPCIADWRYLVLTACANHETKLSIYIFGSILKLSDIETSAQMCRAVSAFLHRFGCWSIQHSDRGARSNYRIYGLPLTMLGTNQKAGPLPIETREMVGLIKHQKISKNHHRTYMSSFLFEDSLSSCHIMSILHHASIIFQ